MLLPLSHARRAGALLLSLCALSCGDGPTGANGAGMTADWSQATEWTTHQGNASHTGYVPVTVDPTVFRVLWVEMPFGSKPLTPVTSAEGKVFVSSGAYFGDQTLAALDARTGRTLWTQYFGSIQRLHPPAYGNGSVYVTTSGHEDSFLWAFEAGSGVVRFRSAYRNQWSTYYAPVIVGDAVYMAGGYGDGVYSFATADGAERWFAATNQYDQWTPAVRDGRIYTYTGSYDPKVTALDARTGAELFAIPDTAFSWNGWSMNLSPVLGASHNLLATNGGRLISFNLALRTIGWQQEGGFVGTVAVAEGLLYVVRNGQVDIRRELDGSLVAPWIPPEGKVQGPLIVTRNLLFASTETTTYAVDLASRKHIWSYPGGGHLALSKDGVLFIAQANGKLAAVGVK